MTHSVEIRPVRSKNDLLALIHFPWKVYRGDPNWVPPLISERLERLDSSKNPFFSHAEVKLFMARRGLDVVGTIAAFVDHRNNKHLGEEMGGFGFFETVEDYQVAEALLDKACQTVRSWGMKGIRGPTNFGYSDEPGVVIEGSDVPPVVLEAHTPPYYSEFLDQYGMTKFRDSYAWRVALNELGDNYELIPEQVFQVFDAVKERGGVMIRKLRMEDWDQEVLTALELFNSTLTHLDDFVPYSEAEFRRFATQMKSFLDPDLALFAEIDGKPVGFLIAIPDINQVLIRLNGRLFPLGWLKALWYRRKIDIISFKLFGVLEQYRRRGIDVLLYLQGVREAGDKGYAWLDGSLTSEFNPAVVHMATRLGAEQYKLFRLYQLEF